MQGVLVVPREDDHLVSVVDAGRETIWRVHEDGTREVVFSIDLA